MTFRYSFLVGDVQGCFVSLQRLLQTSKFNPKLDRLVLLGDLVNRGPASLEVLQFARSLGAHCSIVLGNHDLHLLAVAHGVRKPKVDDTLGAILQHPARADLLDWLRRQPLALEVNDVLCVHAGVLPKWSVRKTLALAAEVQAVLSGNSYGDFLVNMYGNGPSRWQNSLSGAERLRLIVNALTRVRFCSARGELDLVTKEGLGSAPEGFMPWFEVPERKTLGTRIAFGHWSTLGLRIEPALIALDTGCVWGGKLSALRLACQSGPEALFQVDCAEA
jgi:bis(5'-nucleosyl)-tetraphosphatase (symmetrical)